MLNRLLEAIDAYDGETYDEVFREVHDRIASSGSAGKMDIAAITFWKRSGQGAWIKDLLNVPEETVRTTTAAAFAAADDGAALDALAVLPGFHRKEAIATALLSAADPQNFGVMDRRTLQALAALGRGVGTSRGLTLRYLTAVRDLRDELATVRPGLTARDIDKGLYVLGGPR